VTVVFSDRNIQLKEKPLKAAYKGAFLKFVKTFFSVNIKKATLLES